MGTENRVFFTPSADAEFYVELIGISDREAALKHRPEYVAKADAGGGIALLSFSAPDANAVKAALGSAGVSYLADEVHGSDGRLICEAIRFDDPRLGTRMAICCYPEAMPARAARHRGNGYFSHAFPLKRLDHLALMAPKLEETCEAWTSILGVPVFGEVRGTGMVIRQMKVGDAIVELLGPDSPESPMASRPPGMASMCAFEVTGPLDAALTLARERGFAPADARAGILPGTRVTTVPATDFSGIGLQLLEYV